MFRTIAIAACALLAAACTTTSARVADKGMPKPAAGSKVLLVQPDVSLGLLTASGLVEPKADWTQTAQANLASELKAATEGRSLQVRALDPSTAQAGKVGQLLRLHGTVGKSILSYDAARLLPSKKGAFDWTLGNGAQSLAQAYDADYALFTHAQGSYSSSGRVAMMVGMAILGVSVPTGGQTAFASLVDLRTGRVIWFGQALASPDTDMRSPEGARKLVAAMLKSAPL